MTPIVDGEVLKFEPTGLYNGLVLLSDTKTRSFWDHITGECVHGYYKGKVLKINNLLHTTLEFAHEKYDNLKISISKQPLHVKIMNIFVKMKMKKNKHIMPSFFKKTMEKKDDRLDKSDLGIGIWNDSIARFYRYEDILDTGVIFDKFDGRDVIIYINKVSNIPICKYTTGGKSITWDNDEVKLLDGEILDEMPMQLYSRWYGFSFTFKGCQIYKKKNH